MYFITVGFNFKQQSIVSFGLREYKVWYIGISTETVDGCESKDKKNDIKVSYGINIHFAKFSFQEM